MPEPLYLGIDPGASGGFAATHPELDDGVWFQSLDKTERERWDQLCNVVTVANSNSWPIRAAIERIAPGFAGTGKAQMAKLYGSYTALRMALVGLGVTDFAAPVAATWQAGLGIPRKMKSESREQWKRRLKEFAGQLYPQLFITNSTADALLIARYCQLKHEGGLRTKEKR